MSFQKVRFARNRRPDNPDDYTAGVILESTKLARMTVSDISRLFPYSETAKMAGMLQVSPTYDTWNGAFFHSFE